MLKEKCPDFELEFNPSIIVSDKINIKTKILVD